MNVWKTTKSNRVFHNNENTDETNVILTFWCKTLIIHYKNCVHIFCTDTVYWYCVLILCTDTVYWLCVLILCTDTVYWYCVQCQKGAKSIGNQWFCCVCVHPGHNKVNIPLEIWMFWKPRRATVCSTTMKTLTKPV